MNNIKLKTICGVAKDIKRQLRRFCDYIDQMFN